jgi:hypothetical protein
LIRLKDLIKDQMAKIRLVTAYGTNESESFSIVKKSSLGGSRDFQEIRQ